MEYKSEFVETLEILNELGILEHVILIGSWAEYLYEDGKVIDDFISTTKTTDIDFLVKNIRKPRENVKLYDIFEEKGYIPDYKQNGVVVFRKDGFEVEFLARQIGKPSPTVDSTNFGTIETLKHMSLIAHQVIVVEYHGLAVTIPHPVAFVFHKMIINKDRGIKKDKDTRAIKNILFYLEEENKYSNDFRELYDLLTKKEQGYITEYCIGNSVELKDYFE